MRASGSPLHDDAAAQSQPKSANGDGSAARAAAAAAAAEEKRRFRKGLNLRRNDVVALFNVLERLSKSIEKLEMFRRMRARTSAAESFVPSGIRLPYLNRDEL